MKTILESMASKGTHLCAQSFLEISAINLDYVLATFNSIEFLCCLLKANFYSTLKMMFRIRLFGTSSSSGIKYTSI